MSADRPRARHAPMPDPGPQAPPSRAAPARRRRAGRVLRAVVAVGVVLVGWLAVRMSTRSGAPGAGRPGAEGALTRGGRRVAGIERVIGARGRGRLPLYLAPARGPVIDSARVGLLAARLERATGAAAPPHVALVPRDSVTGLTLVGRLVVVPGEPGLLVFGARPGRP